MFWFKKVLSQFVMPVPFILICLFVALFIWRFKAKKLKSFGQFCLAMGLSVLMLLSNSFISANLAESLESRYPVNELPLTQINQDACYVMVLGSGHREKQNISAVQQLSSTALSRLSEGIRQLKLAGSHCTLVVSGWSGGLTPTPHAVIMRQAAIELGVAADNIVIFPDALDTIEEAQSMKSLVGNTPFILVTSATHMPRSMMIFTTNKLYPVAAPTNFLSSLGYWWRFSAENLFISQRAIHEYVGMLWINVKGLITNVL
ncbi:MULTISPECIES: ElyC/SanA/YdcF family protein [Shewanella]|uniref:ElyC/SanA/YdcF family protein n=1 Tax=Shewanella TaxID=22 RepID=UPI001BC0E4F2|nr:MULTISPECIES: ElyC/SanA/YdcF family protein [Shewanella]GIU51244.1 hypothetical protein TUM4249_15270 [Shewanella sp. KT0246]